MNRAYYEGLVEKPKVRRRRKGKGAGGRSNKSLAKNLHCIGMVCSPGGNKKQRYGVIDSMNKQQLGGIKTIIRDFLTERYIVPKTELKKLAKNKKYIYQLLDPKTSTENQKNILKQRGGFLSALIPLAASILPSIVSPLFKAITGGRR